jgi:universal stress protein A
VYPPKRILFTTDFSSAAAEALPWAVQLAAQFQSELHLLNVIEPVAPAVPDEAWISVAAGQQELVKQAAKQSMEQLDLSPAGGSLKVCRVLREGVAYHEIDLYANEHAIDLIVMATHGRTGLSHVLFGSVAERTTRHAPCPVLTVPAAPRRAAK